MLATCIGDRALSANDAFQRTALLFQLGELAASQDAAAWLADQYQAIRPDWSEKFRIQEAESASWRGMSPVVLRALSHEPPASADADLRIRRFSLLAAGNIGLHHYKDAEHYLEAGDTACSIVDRPVCSHMLHAHWALAMERGNYDEATRFSLLEIAATRRFGQRFDEAAALTNRAFTCLQQERFDEAIDWLNASNRIAAPLNAGEILDINMGNLGWAYYSLGDKERGLNLYLDAERRAEKLGATVATITWLTASGVVYRDMQQWTRAENAYRQALQLARTINSSKDIIDCLEDLTHVAIDANRLSEAEGYLGQLDSLLGPNANRLDVIDVILARGRIEAARHENDRAEAVFKEIDSDPASQISMRLGAEHELAKLYETQGSPDQAQAMYATALATFESERAQLKNENSKLPFFANAAPVYDDYIRLLIQQGKGDDALAAADQSRARTLAQGLREPLGVSAPRPGIAAAKAGATLLFYWLGEKQSWLWAITPQKTSLFPLPPRSTIVPIIERYRRALLGPEDPLDSRNSDGLALYRILLAPAKDILRTNARVVILSDGPLSELNFDSLLVPEPTPHYWIEDADITSAPSLHMLAASRPARSQSHNLLLLGNAVSADPDYPSLPNAAPEMQQIRRHFAAEDLTIFAGPRASPGAYLASAPQRFSYIDFVAHGVASRTDPLDSAIILSRTSQSVDSYKLYARDIIEHPIDARLVTISACSGSGERSYAGEGLVGLSWAFLRAGAHNVIAALWEVSDDSTPRLMDTLYEGLDAGMTPSAALRQAKLALLHSHSAFRRPFFWAPFQLYTGL